MINLKQQEGIRGLYCGFGTTVIGLFAHRGIFMIAYELCYSSLSRVPFGLPTSWKRFLALQLVTQVAGKTGEIFYF